MQLHDGSSPVDKLAVILYLRNAERYVTEFLIPYLTTLEQTYSCTFCYYIFENDSTDNTATVLKEFMRSRNGKLVSKTLHLNNVNGNISKSRIERITMIRNMLLNEIRQEIIKTDWCLFIDDNIYPDEEALSRIMDKKPALHNIGMITCNSLELMKNDGTTNIPKEVTCITENHYYDTFAYIDIHNNSYYPRCVHSECTRNLCKEARTNDNTFNCQRSNMIDVRSAWGGFVLIASKVFEHEAVQWKTFSINNQSVCEHIYLCDMIKAFTQKRIVLLEDVVCYWIK